MNYHELDTPALLIDREILHANLRRMQDYADRNGVTLRPHTKTHKMSALALLAEEYGAAGIAVAKTGEAEVMARAGLHDIFIANELVGEQKLARAAALTECCSLSFGVDSVVQIEQAEKVFGALGRTAEVMIEAEIGEGRCGVSSDGDCLALLAAIRRCPHVHLKGFFGTDGNTSYSVPDLETCRRLSFAAQQTLVHFAALARAEGFDAPCVSYGSTPPFLAETQIADGITELRPGTYVFMDASMANVIGRFDRCAATVLATVQSIPAPDRVILDVGAKGITMQERTKGICCSHGKGVILGHPDAVITRIFDEHAILDGAETFARKAEVGQKVRVIPVHICPVCNLYDKAYLISGDEIVGTLTVDGRGRLQ